MLSMSSTVCHKVNVKQVDQCTKSEEKISKKADKVFTLNPNPLILYFSPGKICQENRILF